MIWERARTIGATSATAGHCRAISSASWGVRVNTLPEPKVTPPLEAAPDWTSRLSAPMLAIVFCMVAFEPWPISIMVITALTPMITPNAVNAERILFRRNALSAVRNVRGTSVGRRQRRRGGGAATKPEGESFGAIGPSGAADAGASSLSTWPSLMWMTRWA